MSDLLASGLDALVIAAPDDVHLAALRVAADAAVPVMCEKPIVAAEQQEHLPALLERFRRAGVLLMEQCQWPFVLGTFDALHPPTNKSPTQFAMRLSPANPGESTLRTSLSHFLSIIQARTTVDDDSVVLDLTFEGRGAAEDGLLIQFILHNGASGAAATCRLELQVCPAQPRPAWIEIDGRRMERVVDLDTYGISFVAGERKVSVDDPTRALVYRFVELVRVPENGRITAESERIGQRARLYHRIVGGLVEHLAGRR